MACFTCGKGFKGGVNDLLRYYKKQYEEKGIVRYFYRETANGEIKIARDKTFKTIYDKTIKPNLEKGAEYAHIKEFSGL